MNPKYYESNAIKPSSILMLNKRAFFLYYTWRGLLIEAYSQLTTNNITNENIRNRNEKHFVYFELMNIFNRRQLTAYVNKYIHVVTCTIHPRLFCIGFDLWNIKKCNSGTLFFGIFIFLIVVHLVFLPSLYARFPTFSIFYHAKKRQSICRSIPLPSMKCEDTSFFILRRFS